MSDSNFIPRDISSQELENTPFEPISQPSIGDVMDSFQFNPEDIEVPWDANGNLIFPGLTYGPQDADTSFWQHQTTGFTCAIVAVRGVIESLTGQNISEAQLVYDATSHGWLTDAGTHPGDITKLLDLYNIKNHEKAGATIADLMAELALGHKVIVGVDSGEIWNQDSNLEDFINGQGSDHAIWVTKIDISDPENPKVVINDSGDPDGAGKVYDLATFVDAWEDSGFFYVATDEAPPDIAQVASGFDQATGTFPDMVSYFSNAHPEFNELLKQDEKDVVSDTHELQNLHENPITLLDESSIDALFKTI